MKKGSSPRHSSDRQGRLNRRTCYNRGRYEDTHYIFLQQSEDNSDQDDAFPLQRLKEEYLEKELEPGDTLHTLSIQFNCPVAELKRINNIHRENEIFARRKIKVPVKYYSLLSEKLVGVHKTTGTSKDSSNRSSFEEDVTSSLHPVVTNGQSEDSSDRLFRDVITQENKFSLNGNTSTSSKDVCDNDDSLLIESQPNRSNNEVFQCSGSDWGLSWPQLLLCTLLLGFAGPIVYIFYLKEVLDEKHDAHTSNNTST